MLFHHPYSTNFYKFYNFLTVFRFESNQALFGAKFEEPLARTRLVTASMGTTCPR
jgi:hypothetical protein